MKPELKKAEGQDSEKQNPPGIKEVQYNKEEVNRLAKIWTELRLEKNKMLKEKPELKRNLARLLDEYQEVFSKRDQMYGKTDIMEFSVELRRAPSP